MTEPPPRLAVITGASHGIGAAVGEHLALQGFDLVVNARSASGLDRLAARGRAAGRTVTVVPGDLRDSVTVSAVVAAAADGADFALIALATAVDPETESSVATLDPDRLLETFDVTARVPIELYRSLVPALALRSGSAVFLTSDWALPGSHGPSIFSAAKAALLHFCRTERRAAAAQGIAMSALVLGDVATYDEHWQEPIWTLDNSTDEVLAEFAGTRISLHDVVAVVDLIVSCRSARVDEILLTPVDPSYEN